MTDELPKGFVRMPSGDLVSLMPLMEGRGRICVGPDTSFVRDGY